jgi:hypothetical protein
MLLFAKVPRLEGKHGGDMASIGGDLWNYNLAKVIVVDVSDDYRLMQPPMPSDFYPVLTETWLPRHNLSNWLARENLVNGYLYDWHESPQTQDEPWYVGVVDQKLAKTLTPDFSRLIDC